MASKFLLTAIFLFNIHLPSAHSSLETYIVHLNLPEGRVLSQTNDLENWYNSFLPEAMAADSNNIPSRIVHAYRNVITGFAAKLSPEELKEMEKKDGFLYAKPQKTYSLHTTESPSFLGLYQHFGSWPGANFGEGVIIGVLDSGIAPGHPSFDDEGMPPPPAKWKGKCELNGTATCNNKLIGARNFASDEIDVPPIDDFGHGTHTASTAAGNFVPNASVFGQANGKASGIAPRAHLAIYKVCSTEGGCTESGILAAMDAAIDDGVDILSLSLGGSSVPFYEDSIAIGAYSAMERGIFVSCSAGNEGPDYFSTSNEAPWILTVGASTMDRKIRATVVLGNEEAYDGESLYQPIIGQSVLQPLIYPGTSVNETAIWCVPGSFANIDVKGKVVVCEMGGDIGHILKGETVKDAGGAAMILLNDETTGYYISANAHVLPATQVSYDAGLKIKAYINSSSEPTATISFKGTIFGDQTGPAVTSFSSRGPSLASPGILKPDIIGPGSNILAAWPVSVDNYTNENEGTFFNMISGTSMSCPHLSGIAALIKTAHPTWSPAMIKSAIMTSATQITRYGSQIVDEQYQVANVFAIGAGHVEPSSALDPGLVYDITSNNYISYLCFLYSDDQVATIVNRMISCSGSEYTRLPEAQLNYPSFAIELGNTSNTYSRTVTNVGEANSTYFLLIENVPGVMLTVEPKLLNFTEVNQQMTYKVNFTRQGSISDGTYVQGSIAWMSKNHIVRTPISVKLVL